MAMQSHLQTKRELFNTSIDLMKPSVRLGEPAKPNIRQATHRNAYEQLPSIVGVRSLTPTYRAQNEVLNSPDAWSQLRERI